MQRPATLVFALIALLPADLCAAEQRHLPVFDEIHQLVADEFYDPELHGLDWQAIGAEHRERAGGAPDDEAFAGVVNDMLALLKTSHTRFYIAADPDFFDLVDIFRHVHQDLINARFPDGEVSIPMFGARFAPIDGLWHITDVIPGSQADLAGVLVGDAIAWNDAQALSPVALQHRLLAGPVTMSVARSPFGEARLVTIEPEAVVPHELHRASIGASARAFERDGRRLGYVRIYSWAGLDMHEALIETLKAEPLASAEGLVLDIRGGWGGAQAHYLDLFNPIPTMTMRIRGQDPYTVDDRWRKPVVLLVDEGCRSGKEIFALGFKESGVGPVIGARTGGAVAGGRLFPLSDASALYLAVGEVLVNGERLEGVGVEPDIAVERPIPFCAGADPQLEAALDVLRAALNR